MKLAIWIWLVVLLIAFVAAGVIPQEQYIPPASEGEQVAAGQPTGDTAALADDGYRYKTVRKLRHCRDVSEILGQNKKTTVLNADGYQYKAPESPMELANEYIPPSEEQPEAAPSETSKIPDEYLPPAEGVPEAAEAPEVPQPSAAPADTSETPVSNEYLSPTDGSEVIEGPAETSVLADDGYNYRRVVRYRRDVSELVASGGGYHYKPQPPPAKDAPNVYLPPAEVKETESEVPQEQISPPVKEAEPDVRPVSGEPSNVYLKAAVPKESAPESVEKVTETYLAPAAPEVASSELANDGYRYKTVRRIKYRHRRDVSEIAAPHSGYHYEPPAPKEVPDMYLPPAEVKEVTEAPSNLYLPPAEVKEVPNTYLPPVTPEVPTSELANDGYRYKTVRKIRYRQRRDVSEIIDNESGYSYDLPSKKGEASKIYLSPADNPERTPEITQPPRVSKEYLPPADVKKATPEIPVVPAVPENPAVPETSEVPETTVVPETPIVPEVPEVPKVNNEYLPPADVKAAEPEPVPEVTEVSKQPENPALPEIPEVSETPKVSNEYLSPAEVKETSPEPTEAPQEVADEYIPPVPVANEASVAPVGTPVHEAPVDLPAEIPVYEPVPIIIDVPSETPKISNEYLPPSDELPEVKEAPEETPVESAILAEDGYHYKVGKRFRFRRDVSEIAKTQTALNGYFYPGPAPQPLEVLPAEKSVPEGPQPSNEYLQPVEEAPIESASAASNGYNYEPPAVQAEPLSNEYLSPAEQIPELNEPAPEVPKTYLPPVEEVPEAAALTDDGYRYKTVRRIRY